MRYIIAPISSVEGKTQCNLSARKRSKDGLILLNENDLKTLSGTLEEKAASIQGLLLTESEALYHTNKENWL